MWVWGKDMVNRFTYTLLYSVSCTDAVWWWKTPQNHASYKHRNVTVLHSSAMNNETWWRESSVFALLKKPTWGAWIHCNATGGRVSHTGSFPPLPKYLLEFLPRHNRLWRCTVNAWFPVKMPSKIKVLNINSDRCSITTKLINEAISNFRAAGSVQVSNGVISQSGC